MFDLPCFSLATTTVRTVITFYRQVCTIYTDNVSFILVVTIDRCFLFMQVVQYRLDCDNGPIQVLSVDKLFFGKKN